MESIEYFRRDALSPPDLCKQRHIIIFHILQVDYSDPMHGRALSYVVARDTPLVPGLVFYQDFIDTRHGSIYSFAYMTESP